MRTTRRQAIGVVATTGAGLTICACSSDQTAADPSTTAADPSKPVRIPVADVPEGGGIVRDGVVVTQPTAGEFDAFDAICPHQGCTVDEVTAQAITCPCHGSQFDPATGEMTRGPATTGLTPRKATVEGDELVVSRA